MSWPLQFVSRALEGRDREAVLGDLAECCASDIRAFFDVVGLIVRRQFAVWKDWRPWFALVGAVGVSGVCMSRMFSALNIEIFAQLSAWHRFHVHYNTGVTSFGEDVVYMVCLASAIFCWSLANGFVLRRFTGWAGLFGCAALFTLLTVLKFRTLDGLGLWIVFFVIPAILGATGKVPGMALIVVVVTLLAAATGARHDHALEVFSQGAFPGPTWPATLLPYAFVSWPVLFLRKALPRG